MDEFQEPFSQHFRSEVDKIASLSRHPNTPKEGSPEEAKEKAPFEKWGGDSIMRGGFTDVMMFFLFNLDRTYEDGLWAHWPPIPGPIRWSMTNLGSLVHGGWWRFASCDSSGKPRELYALG